MELTAGFISRPAIAQSRDGEHLRLPGFTVVPDPP
jgi:hypothetical protein